MISQEGNGISFNLIRTTLLLLNKTVNFILKDIEEKLKNINREEKVKSIMLCLAIVNQFIQVLK